MDTNLHSNSKLEGNYRLYSITARIWSIVFLFSGFILLFFSNQLNLLLEKFSSVLGNYEAQSFTPVNPLNVLAVSYMFAITLLADDCAKNPGNFKSYQILILSKLLNISIFVFFSFNNGYIWLLAALVDSLIVLSLVITRELSNEKK